MSTQILPLTLLYPTNYPSLPPCSLADAAGIDPTGVVFIIAAAANGGESVDVAFSVRSEGVNVKALSQIVSSDEAKAKVVAALVEAGYDTSDVNGTPTVVNLSPTARPTSMPTMKLTVVRAMQRVIGATLENADYEAFRTAIEQVTNHLNPFTKYLTYPKQTINWL